MRNSSNFTWHLPISDAAPCQTNSRALLFSGP